MAIACGDHTLADTRLACGRCDRPVCGRCVVTTMVGTRCRSCAPEMGARSFRAARAAAAAQAGPFGIPRSWRLIVGLAALAICPALILYSYLEGDRDRLVVRVTVYGGWVASLVLHELAHGCVAYVGGDRSVRERGFLTLNPLRYMDPVMSVAVPLLFVMLGGMPLIGGRTLVHREHLRSSWWGSAVSLAGPGTNIVIAAAIGLAFRFGLVDPATSFGMGLAFLGLLQVWAALFNAIPIPPLDGFGALAPHLSHEFRLRAAACGWRGYFVLIAVFWFVPGLGAAISSQATDASLALYVPTWAAEAGSYLAQF